MSLLNAEDITVHDGTAPLLHPISLQLNPGEPLIILGETGSGKSLLAQALMGTLPSELKAKGQVTIGSHVLNANAPEHFRSLWGRELGVLPQEPWLSLDPLMRARAQVAETHALVRGLSHAKARTRAASDLAELGLADAGMRFPHELSGGMAQRVAIAAARAGGARIVIADEPTKGLDAARRDEVANLLLAEMGQTGGLLIITHDLALAQRIGGRLIVLRTGDVVESGATQTIFAAPTQAYTRDLLAADPESWAPRRSTPHDGPAVVSARNLALARGERTLFRDVSLEISAGEVFGVTGPSGCGKSTLGDALLGVLPPSEGQIQRQGDVHPFAFQKLYQDPVAAFPRKRTIGAALRDVVTMINGDPHAVDALMDSLGLDPKLLARRPGAVSGGELQRLSLLRVLLRKPAFIFADEPTSRLDPITQAKVIGLLTQTAERDGIALMLVSHDQALVRNTADRVLPLAAPDEPDGAVPQDRVASALH